MCSECGGVVGGQESISSSDSSKCWERQESRVNEWPSVVDKIVLYQRTTQDDG